MRMYDVIVKKKRGGELSTEEINYFVDGFTKGEIPDYQVSALTMAIYFQKMSARETADLTMAMVKSGDVLDLSEIDGIKVDKHSTGGVGDSVSLPLTSMVAACGVKVAKMSGRGLGHTGGTIDKLESFKGFSIELPKDQFIKNVNDIGISLVGQSGELAPADKKLYALRDVTATVDNMSLIASSIMSKKIASGADGIVLDVKVGEGAFMKTYEDAKSLASEMVSIGTHVNRKTIAVISDMDQPLGYAIGNILEVKEAIDILKGKGPNDLLELVLTLGSNMLLIAKKADDFEDGKQKLLNVIKDGSALKKFKEFIAAQGGETDCIDNPELFPKAEYEYEVKAEKDGVISKIHAESVGIAAMELGAGRATKDSVIDLTVGIVLKKKRGENVKKGDTLAVVYGNDTNKCERAVESMQKCIVISDNYTEHIPLIYDIVR